MNRKLKVKLLAELELELTKEKVILSEGIFKVFFRSKAGQINSAIEFRIFELVLAQSFILTRQFIFGPNLSRKGVCTSKEKNRIHNVPISLIPNFISSQQL